MEVAALVISIVALVWPILWLWWQQTDHVEVEAGTIAVSVSPGDSRPYVTARVKNKNPRRPIRIETIAFASATVDMPRVWLDARAYGLAMAIPARDAETAEVPADEVGVDDLGPTFRAWVELKTGAIISSESAPAPD